jgi:lipoprotein-anchoring transpeptidase ErfK/SrfK
MSMFDLLVLGVHPLMRHSNLWRALAVAAAVLVLTLSSLEPAVAASDIPSGSETVRVQLTLQQLKFYRGPISGVDDQATADAIMAFHKVVGADRIRDWIEADWENARALESVGFDIPRRPDEPNRIEVDLYRQVMYLVFGGHVQAVFPIVSGKADTYERLGHATAGAHTPVGDFTLIRHVDGWRTAALGRIYHPWYFVGGYAIHGSRIAHPQPASHGCIRVPMADMDWLESRLWLGIPVHVWVGSEAAAVGTYVLEHQVAALQFDVI